MKWTRLVGFVGLGSFAATCGMAACSNDAEDCNVFNTCGTSAGNTTSTGGGGNGGNIDPGCVPSALPANTPIPDSCAGVFVSASLGNDANDGTKAAPFQSLDHAIQSGATIIYACGEALSADTAKLTVPAGTTLFGGLDCVANWVYTGDKSTFAPNSAIALVLATGAAVTRIEDFAVEAANGAAAGDSSIGVIADNATVTLLRVDVVAGNGVAGAPGTSPQADNSLNGNPGFPGGDDAGFLCSGPPTINPGGPPGTKTCGAEAVDGGAGGIGNVGGGNVDGDPGKPLAAGGGVAGAGSAGTCVTGGSGGPGTPGLPGADGVGATGVGLLTAAGYSAPIASAAGPGHNGGGGGGGRGIGCQGGSTGPSGGGGASGACGGAPAGAGTGGGSSLALVAIGGTVTLADVSLTTGAGGLGGAGGTGQPGGFGSNSPGGGSNGACPGGIGGDGGAGGDGGGGLGGHSVAVATTAATTLDLTNVTYVLGTSGGAGPGGDGNASLNGGAGQRCESLDFDTGTCTNA